MVFGPGSILIILCNFTIWKWKEVELSQSELWFKLLNRLWRWFNNSKIPMIQVIFQVNIVKLPFESLTWITVESACLTATNVYDILWHTSCFMSTLFSFSPLIAQIIRFPTCSHIFWSVIAWSPSYFVHKKQSTFDRPVSLGFGCRCMKMTMRRNPLF
jgi:hypothetical protein